MIRILTVFNANLSKPRHTNNVRHQIWCEAGFSVVPIVQGCRVQGVHQCGLSVGVKVLTIPDLYLAKKNKCSLLAPYILRVN